MNFFHEVGSYLSINHASVLSDLGQHAQLALEPVAIAFVASLPIGWLASEITWLRHVILTLGNVVYTIPSLAMLLVLPGLLGTSILDETNVVIALALYTVALLVPRVVDGLRTVDAQVLEAATAMGYRPLRRWFVVQLPLALPVIFAGVRVATIANVSMVSVASLIGIGGLGELFTRGFELGFYAPPIVIGLVLSVALAFTCDMTIVLIQRAATPWTRGRVKA